MEWREGVFMDLSLLRGLVPRGAQWRQAEVTQRPRWEFLLLRLMAQTPKRSLYNVAMLDQFRVVVVLKYTQVLRLHDT